MIRQFNTREDGADNYATYLNDQVYIEVPLGADEATSNKID